MQTVFKAAAVAVAMTVGGGASAATIDFDSVSGGQNVDLGGGFVADDLRVVNGNCASGSCAALNTNGPRGNLLDATTISRSDGALFSLDSFWYQRLGKPSEVTVTTSAGQAFNFTDANSDNNVGTVVDTSLNALFQNISFITFENTGTGNIRIDDLGVAGDPNAVVVPLPAAGWLLIAGLGGLGLMGRRRKTA